jgi:hypothetical protein
MNTISKGNIVRINYSPDSHNPTLFQCKMGNVLEIDINSNYPILVYFPELELSEYFKEKDVSIIYQ